MSLFERNPNDGLHVSIRIRAMSVTASSATGAESYCLNRSNSYSTTLPAKTGLRIAQG